MPGKKGGTKKKKGVSQKSQNDVMFKQAWMYAQPVDKWTPPPLMPHNITKTPKYIKKKKKLPPRGK